ncbi:hypothetical protein GYMLUDRAFT_252629 [Collybiopsis luxurians FD-317 M1]|uniref:Uncharacterized protein n=1 Tax=Collybiopsis luxurians FD-317 M1 TaxID=944289 RepID=A0A0D0B9D2_9AGAR|nr:hypothetical protein GYMLUDRAFT_252629 [Collybiopsis luxurians FD-317 M1]
MSTSKRTHLGFLKERYQSLEGAVDPPPESGPSFPSKKRRLNPGTHSPLLESSNSSAAYPASAGRIIQESSNVPDVIFMNQDLPSMEGQTLDQKYQEAFHQEIINSLIDQTTSEGGNSDPHLFDSVLLSSTVKKATTNALFTANELR